MIGFEYFQEIKNREVKRQENPPGQAAQTARPGKGPLHVKINKSGIVHIMS